MNPSVLLAKCLVGFILICSHIALGCNWENPSTYDICSPGYPRNYSNSDSMRYLIQAPLNHRVRLKFSRFHVESGYPYWTCVNDNLSIYDAGQPYPSELISESCGTNQATYVTSSDNIMTLIFKTNSMGVFPGFKAEVQFVKSQRPSSGAFYHGTYIISPHFFRLSPYNAIAFYYITAPSTNYKVYLNFTEFSLGEECSRINLTIYDGDPRYSGSQKIGVLCRLDRRRIIVSNSHVVVVIFRSHLVGMYSGFRAVARFIPKACTNGTYGPNCEDVCSDFCVKGNTSCDITTGECPGGCVAGYNGSTCDEVCTNGTYGPNCEDVCSDFCVKGDTSCDIATGECPGGCVAGYKGSTCDEVCNNGTYGPNCEDVCSDFCMKVNTSCDITTGECPGGCVAGYNGSTCDEECQSGTYGVGCLSRCSEHCAGSNRSCNHIDGTCEQGCQAGYTNLTCDQVLQAVQEAQESPTTLNPVYPVTSVSVVLFVVVISVIAWRLYRKWETSQKSKCNLQMEIAHITQNQENTREWINNAYEAEQD